MSDWEPTQEKLDDAIIEDSCRCQCCGTSFVLGGNDDVLVEVPQTGGRVAQLSLCIQCAKAVHDTYRESLAEAGLCEHGQCLSQPCSDCLAPINLCKEIVQFWGSHEAWGDFASLTSAAGAFGPIADRARRILEGLA